MASVVLSSSELAVVLSSSELAVVLSSSELAVALSSSELGVVVSPGAELVAPEMVVLNSVEKPLSFA